MLFEQWNLKHLTIKNRICVPAMMCHGFVENQSYVGTKHLQHYSSIAKGGTGLIIVEATCISEEGKILDEQLGIWDDSHIEGLSKISKVIHEENIPAILQLYHAGGVGIHSDLYSASDYTCIKRGEKKVAKEMSVHQIKLIQKQFVEAAIRAYQANYDGIELHGCHSYLISQFLNKKVNQRNDEYGRNPMLFIREIIQDIRNHTPQDFIVGIRLGGFEPKLEDALNHAKQLEEIGIDFIDVSYGFSLEHEPYVPDDYLFKDIIYAADMISQHVSVSVFAVNGIQTKEQAESIIANTNISMVDIGRATLVNYNWANDVKAGKNPGKCLNCKECKWHIDGNLCPERTVKRSKDKQSKS